MLKAMAESKMIKADIQLHAIAAASLNSHWHDERTQSKLKSKAWKFVILQDQSITPIVSPESTLEFGGKFCRMVHAGQGVPMLFLTWGRQNEESPGTVDMDEQKALNATYQQLARQNKAHIVPVGIAWEECTKRYPKLALYQEDGKHPSLMGSYLTACVMYCSLFGKSPVGLPGKLSLQGVLLCNLTPAEAKILQAAALQACKKWKNAAKAAPVLSQ